MTRREHYQREKKARELRDRLRSQVFALAERSAGSREYADATEAFARGRAELRREREARTKARLRRQTGRTAPWDSPRALARRLAAWDVADARWTDWAERTVLAARAGAEPPLAPGERRRAESGRLCKRSISPVPKPEMLRTAWAAARGGRKRMAEAVRLGSLLLDLEASLGAARRHGADGRIVGRQPGLRGWLARHAPDLSPHYDSLLRARRLAQALRLAYGLRDPLPASLLVEDGAADGRDFPAPLRERIGRSRAAARALLASPAGRSAAALGPALAKRAPPTG